VITRGAGERAAELCRRPRRLAAAVEASLTPSHGIGYARQMQSKSRARRATSATPVALTIALASACAGAGDATEELAGAGGYDPREAVADAALPDVRCDADPDAGARRSWRHLRSRVIALQHPRHRGRDLVVAAAATEQTLQGEISYGLIDKALEDERVDLFACRAGAWQRLGTALTDDEGGFRLPLTGAAMLPIGLRDLFVSVQGDRSGARFLALVAPAQHPLLVSDLDGTLTSSENAFPTSLVTGAAVAAHDGAREALEAAAARGDQPVYLSARGDVFTVETRRWLAERGLPRGPLRLAPSAITLPGDATVELKVAALAALRDAGLRLDLGVGNRASDVAAYGAVGLAGDHVFVKLPEFDDELRDALADGRATGFASYRELPDLLDALPPL
jgi:LNS2 (Lipin/Ned1/Smp2)